MNETTYYTSMTVVNWFDTVSTTWGYDNATGINVLPRNYHTADLSKLMTKFWKNQYGPSHLFFFIICVVPGTSKILIYGGVQNTETGKRK
jgi:hypothetical protein